MLLTSCSQLLLLLCIFTALLIFLCSCFLKARDQAVSWQSAPSLWHHFPKHSTLEVCPYMEELHFLLTVRAILLSLSVCVCVCVSVCVRAHDREEETWLTLQGRQTWPSLHKFTRASLWLSFLHTTIKQDCCVLMNWEVTDHGSDVLKAPPNPPVEERNSYKTILCFFGGPFAYTLP